ncbi:MAG: DEAD/DEAH box helicase [Alphaproteobacteria bacterium]|nr:DEAD/DEAH box helicase [Alphaproteobacteria bacterium]
MKNLFSDLALSDALVANLTAMGFDTPTPIQHAAIPHILQGRDLCACAQTGSGKTGAFLLPIIDMLINSRVRVGMPRAIILSPTRELAQQVHDNFKVFSKGMSLGAAVLVGGEWTGDQEKQLKKKPDLIIATPGRLLDLFERGKLLMMDTKILVIDEADRMLDMGFMPDVDRILKFLPKDRQTLLISATFPKELQAHMDTLMSNPKRIESAALSKPAGTIKQYKVAIESEDKQAALRQILSLDRDTSAIVFCNRKKDVDSVAKYLKGHGFKSMPIHGDLAQSKRNETLDIFRAEKGLVLVASDVAARGIDIDDLPLVINYDIPINAEDYVHRIGRTGRAGKSGVAYSFVTKRDKKSFDAVLKISSMPIEDYIVTIEKDIPKSSQKAHSRQVKSSQKETFLKPANDESKAGFGDWVPRFILADPRKYFG